MIRMKLPLYQKIIGLALIAILSWTALAQAQHIEVYFSLTDDPEGAIIKELNSAQETMDIAMYSFTDRDLAIFEGIDI